MALAKKAKKFRAKHLGDKIEQKKREKKHAQIVKHRKSKPNGTQTQPSTSARKGPDLDVKEQELFDFENDENEAGNGIDKYLSDSEEDIEAEEQAYLAHPESDGAQLPSKITETLVETWRAELKKNLNSLKLIVLAASPEKIENIANEATLDLLREVLVIDVPRAVAKHFPKVSPADSQFKKQKLVFKSLADLMGQLLVDVSSADSDALIRVVNAVKQLLPYFTSFKNELKVLIKGLVAVVVRSDRDDRVKLVAFDAIKIQIGEDDDTSSDTGAARTQEVSGAVLASIAKQAYTSLVKAAAHTNSYSIDSINLAKNLFATLFARAEAHPELYQLAFQQIRQLALLLKTALDKIKHAEFDTKVVYTWQFVQSLDFWSRAVSLSAGLHALIHPLCQVTLRTISLVPSQQYLPLRFYLVRSLIRLGQHTGVFIPLAPPLLEAVLQTSVLSKPGKPASLQQPDFEALLHVPSGYLGTLVYQNCVLDEFVDVLVDALVLYTKSIAFPELVAPITVVIRKFAKHQSPSTNTKIRRGLVSLCEQLDANSQFILKHRAQVKFNPQNKAAVSQFLNDVDWKVTPLGKEAVARRKVREQRRELVAKAKQEDQTNEELAEFAGSDDEDHDDSSDREDEAEIEAALEELEEA